MNQTYKQVSLAFEEVQYFLEALHPAVSDRISK